MADEVKRSSNTRDAGTDASIADALPPRALRERILAAVRPRPFTTIRDAEGIWLPAAQGAEAKLLYQDAGDRLSTRLLSVRRGYALPRAPLSGRRALFLVRGALAADVAGAAAETPVNAGDFVEGASHAGAWAATEDAIVLELSDDVARGSNVDTSAGQLQRAERASWVDAGGGAHVRPLAGAPSSGRQLFVLRMDPRSTLREHEHHGAEELYVLQGSCEIEGAVMRAGDYHRAASSSSHQATHCFDEGCTLFVAIRNPDAA